VNVAEGNLEVVELGQANSKEAANRFLPLVYDDLRRLAAAKLAREIPGQTLQGTALVHEAWIKLSESDRTWNDPAHFFRAAADAMRCILIDLARKKKRVRHGANLKRVALELERVDLAEETEPDLLLALDDGLMELAAADPVKAELVKLRFYVGMSVEEAGQTLHLSMRTAQRYWTFSRAWLYDWLRGRFS